MTANQSLKFFNTNGLYNKENMGSSKRVCLVLACMVSMLEFSLIFAFGAVFVELMNTYRIDRSTAATVQSLLIGITLSFGIGISLTHVSAVTSVRVFAKDEKRIVLFATIHTTSVTFFGIIYPYLLQWLVKSYGLNGTFLILGGLYCNAFAFFVFLCQQQLQPEREEITDIDSQLVCSCRKGRQLLKIFKNIISFPFLFSIVANGLAMATVNGYLELSFDIAEWKGNNESETKELFVILNCSNVLATLTPGLIKQKFKVNAFIFLITSSFAGCVGHILVYFSNSYSIYAVASGCIGIVPGGIISSSIIFMMETMNEKQFSVATGLMFTVIGVLSAIAGPVFGIIRDITGSYGIVLISISTLQAVSTLLYVIALICQRNFNNSY